MTLVEIEEIQNKLYAEYAAAQSPEDKTAIYRQVIKNWLAYMAQDHSHTLTPIQETK